MSQVRPSQSGQHRTNTVVGSSMVVASAVCLQSGQALAKLGFTWASPVTMTALRFGLGAAVLWLMFRPQMLRDGRSWAAVVGMGIAVAGANAFVNEAAARLSFGLAVTIQFLGPLTVAMLGIRRWLELLWIILAATGVIVINNDPHASLSTPGLLYAAASALCWGGYVISAAAVSSRTSGTTGLVWASICAAVLTVPLPLATETGAFVRPYALGVGLAVAVLCTVIANSLELNSLRRIPPSVFGILVSLEPVVAAAVGYLLLGDKITILQGAAIGLIVAASIGTTTTHNHPSQRAFQAHPQPSMSHPLGVHWRLGRSELHKVPLLGCLAMFLKRRSRVNPTRALKNHKQRKHKVNK